ncbi:MAG: MBL fold metallo-hydrolase [Spirochaetaceae bacterium]|jgi:phosphoribosyl 1,2-cyclic phosphodiesterase|nr:MBL fold metallo-hydrolase [Spirochaetaceae bacterium]
MLQIRFWGTRGSIAISSPDKLKLGGNTACIEMRLDNRLVIIDLGSGAYDLGNYLMANDFKKGPIECDIFVSHTHMDHLYGFPMFAPMFIRKNSFRVHGPRLPGDSRIGGLLDFLSSYPLWPVHLSKFDARLSFNSIFETTLDLGHGLKVTSKLLNHPVITLGYRFEYQGKTIVTAFDTEPHYNMFADKQDPFYSAGAESEAQRVVEEENKKFIEFIRGADVLIHDACYTEAEYHGKEGWGHTTIESAISGAKEAGGVKKLVLFHHSPSRTDKDMNEIMKRCPSKKSEMEIIAAKEGMLLTV